MTQSISYHSFDVFIDKFRSFLSKEVMVVINMDISGKLERVISNDRLLVRDKIKKESQIILLRSKKRVFFDKNNIFKSLE